MAQKQKSFLIIAGLIFLCSVVLLTLGLIAKAQTIATPFSLANGANCLYDIECNSQNCCAGKCVASDTKCPTDEGKTCFQLGEGCILSDYNNNCCSPYICDQKDNICKPAIIPNCKITNDSCVSNADCCSPNVCVDYFCKPCLGLKTSCSTHSQCCSGNCPPASEMFEEPYGSGNYISKPVQSTCGSPLPSGGQIGSGGGEFAPSVGLTVSYPNGGESWQAGQLYQIKWKTQSPDNFIGIVIWNYDYPDQMAPQAYKIIATNNNKPEKGATDQGGTNMSYSWEIQPDFFTANGTWKPTDNLRIIITETTQFGGQAGKDISDGYFNIAPAPAQIKKCPDCGNGILNLCDKNECLAIDPHCLFSSYIGGGKCSPGGCATNQECAVTNGCASSDYLAKCDIQKRTCSCIPAVTEQKISFKITTDGSAGPGSQAVSQATVKVFDSQSKQAGSCVTDQNGSCVTNELIPIGYGNLVSPTKSYSTKVSASGFLANSTVNFDAVLNMAPVAISLYKNTQTTFKATIDLNNFWGVHIGISKKGESQALPWQECFAINPPQKCIFSLPNGFYRAFIVDYQFCWDEVGGCFTDFEIDNSDVVVNLVAKMTKVKGSPSPYCSRTDGGSEYVKGAVRYFPAGSPAYGKTVIQTQGKGLEGQVYLKEAEGSFPSNYAIDHCIANTSFSYISSMEGPAVAQYDCKGWPKSTACPKGCYDGACLIDCSKMSLSLGGFCAKESQLATVCGKDELNKQSLSDSFCDKQGGNYCVFCAKPCSTKNDCSYLTSCPNNQIKVTEPDCVNNKCACRDLSCSQDSNCANIACASDQTPICNIKTYSGTSPILLKECFCLNNTSQKRILVHADDNFTTEDLPGILVSILDKGKQVASCVTSDPRGKCTIPALTFSPASDYSAVVRGVPGYKDAEIKLVSRSNVDDVSANFHLLSGATDVVTCSKNNDCAKFPCSLGQNPTCSKDRCACQSGEPVIGCSTDNDCISLCSNGQKQVCANSLCGCKDVVVPPKSLPDLTVTPTLSCLKSLYNTGESISGCSINIKNIGTAPTTIAPKTNLYNVTNSQQWQTLSQIATPGVLGQNASAIITFGNFALAAPGTYQLRACIDDDPKVIEESDENNNCSAVLPITVKVLPITAVFKITTGSLEDQKPVPNAKVKLFLDSPNFSEANMANLAPDALCSQLTDAKGVCAAENLLEGKKYMPYVEASGYECTSWWCGKNQIFTAKANDEIHGLMLSPKDVVVPPKSLPDLTVTPTLSCLKSLYNTGESISGCSINIKNIGTAPTTIAPKTNLYNVTDANNWKLLSQIATPGVLGQNASAIITFGNFAFTAPGAYQLRACIDDDPKVIEESDENNNCSAVLPITVEASLKIAKTSFRAVSGNNKAPVVGAQISLSPVDSPNTQKASCSTDSAGLCSADLISGVKYSISASADKHTCGGCASTFIAQLDGPTHTLIFEPIPADVFLPDLKVIGVLACSQTSYNVGDSISGCSINIKNIGTANTTIAPKINLYDVTGSAWKQLSQIPYYGVLGQNASAIITFGNFGLAAPGTYQLRACVDDDPKVIEELDENNNCSAVLPIEVKTIPGTKPITVISPNGREIFEIGKTYKLDWQASGLNSTSKLKVFVCTDQSTPICLSSVINDGVLLPITQTTLAWTIPANIFSLFAGGISTNDRFKIQVSEILANSSTGIWDRSDDSFSIVATTTIKCSTIKDCANIVCIATKTLQCSDGQCVCKNIPALIDCKSKYNSAYWCSSYPDWTNQCAGKADPNAIKQEVLCNENGGNYCVTCASNVKPLCSDCGKGILNTCDEQECHNLGKECVFSEGLLGLSNKCSSQNEAEIKVSLPGENPAEMVIPKGTFIVTVVPEINVLNSNSVDTSGLSGLGRRLISGQVIDFSVKDANGDEIHNFSQPIAIQIPYTDEQVKGFNEDDLKISIFNEQTKQWEVLPTTVDKKNKLLKAQTNHFSLLAVAAGTGPADTLPTKEIPASPACKNAKECCNLYCGDITTWTMPVGTACVCSRNNPKCPASNPNCTLEARQEGLIDRATNWIFYLGLILAPLFILIGAFMIMAGGGNYRKRKNTEGIEGIFNPTVGGGKKMIIYAVIGLALALCTRLIYHLVRFLIGQ